MEDDSVSIEKYMREIKQFPIEAVEVRVVRTDDHDKQPPTDFSFQLSNGKVITIRGTTVQQTEEIPMNGPLWCRVE